jgi:dephospho-CoA kinase
MIKSQEKPRSQKPLQKSFLRKHKPTVLLAPNNGKVIGVTGGIATGKSFVLECFKKLGFEVFNADKAVHELLEKNGKAYKLVAELCPEAATEEGIDRVVLSEKVFSDSTKLSKLEAILHPLVRQAQAEFLIKTKNNSGKSAVFEVPLLFENKRETYYDYIILTKASLAVQKTRALARKNMTEEKFAAIIAKQLPDHIKVKKADFVINTDKTPEITFKTVRDLVYGNGYKGNSTGHRNNRVVRKKR